MIYFSKMIEHSSEEYSLVCYVGDSGKENYYIWDNRDGTVFELTRTEVDLFESLYDQYPQYCQTDHDWYISMIFETASKRHILQSERAYKEACKNEGQEEADKHVFHIIKDYILHFFNNAFN